MSCWRAACMSPRCIAARACTALTRGVAQLSARPASATHRTARGGQCIEHPLVDRLDRIERLRDVTEQDLRIVVQLIDRHPRKRLAVALGPLRQQRRLPVTRRRDHRDNRVGAPLRQSFDQQRTADGPGSNRGTTELRRDDAESRPARRPGSVGLLTFVAIAHALSGPPVKNLPVYDRTITRIRSSAAWSRQLGLLNPTADS
jgi:hypothetical protein